MKKPKSFTILLIFVLSLASCKTSPLMNAVITSDIKNTNELLDQGADINECFRYTPLMRAILNKQIEMAKLLIDRGADINDICSGSTPLMWAVYTGQIEMIKLLLDRGADVNIYYKNVWYTALYFSIIHYDNELNDTIQILLEKGATVYPHHIKYAESNPAIKYDTLQMLKEPQMQKVITSKYKQGLLLAVLDFEPRGMTRQDAMRLSDWLRTELINTGQFKVIERNAMNEILKEQAFSLTGCTDTTCAVQVGKLLSAKKMLVGNVELWDNKIFINGRIIDVEKGIAEFAHKETVNSMKELDTGATKFAKNLARRINGLPVQ